jgi:hypothetical protein
MCAYEKMCTYKKGALNNPSLRYERVDSKSSAGTVFLPLLPSSLPGELLTDTRKSNGLVT